MTSFPDFKVVTVEGGPVTLRVAGELDISTAPQLRLEIDAAMTTPPGDLILDLSEVTFLDSSGLAVLFSAARRLARHDARVTVRGLQAQCLRTVQLVGLADVLDLEA